MNYPPSALIRAILVQGGVLDLPGETNAVCPAYVSRMPDGDDVPDSAACLFDIAGLKQGRLMSGAVQERMGVQLMVRDLAYPDAWRKMAACLAVLDAVVRQGIDTGEYFYFIPAIRRGTVLSVGGAPSDEQRRLAFTCNLDFRVDQEGPYSGWGQPQQEAYQAQYAYASLIQLDPLLYFGE